MRRSRRITADEEERLRKGYELETFYQFAPESPGSRVEEADVVAKGTPVLRLVYAPAATVLRVNHGWRGEDVKGFLVDFESGEIVSPAEADADRARQPRRPERVRLAVSSTHSLLLIRPLDGEPQGNHSLGVSLRYALKRGLEEHFELEETELAAETIGTGEHRAILLYETAEGGAGVVQTLVKEPGVLAEVARRSLEICHFSAAGEDLKPECHAACYECLLSFNNQVDALKINRHRIRQTLLDLAESTTQNRKQGRSREEHLAWLLSLTDPRSELERRLLNVLAQGGYPLPDDAQKSISEPPCVVDFFYEPNICVFCDGTPHRSATQSARDKEVRLELQHRGYRVIVIRYDRPLDEQVKQYLEGFKGS